MRHKTHPRRATTLHELLVAIGVLSAIASLVFPTSVKIMRARQTYRDRLVAMEELANQMERLTLTQLDELPAAIEALSLSPETSAFLYQADLQGISKSSEHGVQLRLHLTWTNRWGNRAGPVSLTTWLFPDRQTTQQGITS